VRPILVINPRNDAAFVEHVAEQLDRVEHPEDFERRLRSRYPDAAVHPRELSSEPVPVWYVYRDGRWTHGGVVRQEDG
jgi:hypothetical protein